MWMWTNVTLACSHCEKMSRWLVRILNCIPQQVYIYTWVGTLYYFAVMTLFNNTGYRWQMTHLCCRATCIARSSTDQSIISTYLSASGCHIYVILRLSGSSTHETWEVHFYATIRYRWVIWPNLTRRSLNNTHLIDYIQQREAVIS